MTLLRFDGCVVVVTGAGAGLGRAYALLFASRGAKVVVNDLGGGRHGNGSSSKAADSVVEEIKNNGGIAVADYNSVTEGEKIIKTALDNFGRIDVLVNNAGILRDKSFARISDEDWDLIHAVHLKGSFKTTQAAFPIFKKQGYGRIIMTSSNSGLYGNFGQANYSAAKMGLVGLANTIAIEGQKYNIHCNVIVPTAASRLTQELLPPDLFAELKPELIAPVVAYLCHESCPENGSIIESAAGWAGKCQIVRSNGAILRTSISKNVTIEDVQNNWSKVTDMSNFQHLNTIGEATTSIIGMLENLREDNNKSDSNSDENLYKFNINFKDIILYNIAIGATLIKQNDLKFLYENVQDFSALPTFYILPSLQCLFDFDLSSFIPNSNINLTQILHGEQYIEVLGDLPIDGILYSKLTKEEVLDKGSGAVCAVKCESFDCKGNLLFVNQIVCFVKGAGGFGGQRNGTKIIPTIMKPSRNSDINLKQKTSIDQAALYRLCGDLNPLHIDPAIAAMNGFKQPILHGLCTLGISVKLVLEAFAESDPKAFKACKARFMKPVIPGQTLRVDMWREGNRIHFETIVEENGLVVIGGAYVDLKTVKMVNNSSSNSENLASDAVFEYIIEQVKADSQKAKQIGGVFLYNITKNGKQVKQWTMDLTNSKVYEGSPQGVKANTILTVSDEDFVQMAQGKLQPQAAFMKGRLKVTGNIMMAQKLAPLLKATAKL